MVLKGWDLETELRGWITFATMFAENLAESNEIRNLKETIAP